MRNKRLASLCLIACMAMMLTGCSSQISLPEPQAQEGLLDLTSWRWQDEVVALDGQWEFYADQLIAPQDISTFTPAYIRVPSTWNKDMFRGEQTTGDGYATYRLLFQTEASGRLALKLPRILTAYRLWINRELVATAGSVGTSRSEMIPQYLPQVVFFEARAGQNELVVHVSNFYHRSGGIRESITLGSERLVLKLREQGIAYELFLFGSLAIIGVYHICLYLFRKQDKPSLYIGVFSLLIAIRTLMVGGHFVASAFSLFNWEAAHKLQTLTFYLGVPLALLFFQAIFPRDLPVKLVKAVVLTSLFFICLVLFTPARVFTVANPLFQVIAVCISAFVIIVFIKLVRRQEQGSGLIVMGGLALFLFGLNDIVFVSIWRNDNGPTILSTLVRSGNLSAWGQLVFVFANSLVLAQKFTRALEQRGIVTTELQQLNLHLDELVRNRTAALEASREQIEQQKHDLEEANRSLRLLSLKDSLTGLWNRRHYDDVVQREWDRALRHQRPLSLLLVDIDRFKAYNDCYGHIEGDVCLTLVAQAIQRCFKRSSDLVARYGGEEFVAIMPELGKQEALRMACLVQNTIEAMQLPHDCSDIVPWVTISVGVTSSVPCPDSSAAELLLKADKALYEAKSAGRNRVRFLS